jgi:hypothetical protein
MTTFCPGKMPLYCAHCGDARIMHMPEDMACVKKTEQVEIWPIVIKEMEARDQLGRERYGVPLTANNGRDALWDAYEEVLDQAVYIRAAIFERDELWKMIKSLNAVVAGKMSLDAEETAKIAGFLKSILSQKNA